MTNKINLLTCRACCVLSPLKVTNSLRNLASRDPGKRPALPSALLYSWADGLYYKDPAACRGKNDGQVQYPITLSLWNLSKQKIPAITLTGVKFPLSSVSI